MLGKGYYFLCVHQGCTILLLGANFTILNFEKLTVLNERYIYKLN